MRARSEERKREKKHGGFPGGGSCSTCRGPIHCLEKKKTKERSRKKSKKRKTEVKLSPDERITNLGGGGETICLSNEGLNALLKKKTSQIAQKQRDVGTGCSNGAPPRGPPAKGTTKKVRGTNPNSSSLGSITR